MKHFRWIGAASGILLTVILSVNVLATTYLYQIPVTVTENGTTGYPNGIALTFPIDNNTLIASHYINASANNTDFSSGTGYHLPGGDRVGFFLPTVTQSSTDIWLYYLGASDNLTKFPIITGYTGNVTTADDPILELGNNGTVNETGWLVPTLNTASKLLAAKPGAFTSNVSNTGSVRSTIEVQNLTMTLVPDAANVTNIPTFAGASTHWQAMQTNDGNTSYVNYAPSASNVSILTQSITAADNVDVINSNTRRLAQSFSLLVPGQSSGVDINFSVTNNPGTLNVTLCAQTAGNPGTVLAWASRNVTGYGGGFTSGNTTFNWTSVITLNASQTYYIVLIVPEATASNTVAWGQKGSYDSYIYGSVAYSTNNGSSWTGEYPTYDNLFELWGITAQMYGDQYSVGNATANIGFIQQVKVGVFATASGNGTVSQVLTTLITNGSSYNSTTQNVTINGTVFQSFNTTYVLNPQTGLAWTWAAVNNIQLGVTVGADVGTNTTATYLFAEISYTNQGYVYTTSIIRPYANGPHQSYLSLIPAVNASAAWTLVAENVSDNYTTQYHYGFSSTYQTDIYCDSSTLPANIVIVGITFHVVSARYTSDTAYRQTASGIGNTTYSTSSVLYYSGSAGEWFDDGASWVQNPQTGLPWQSSQLSSLWFGASFSPGSGAIAFTQAYMEVSYYVPTRMYVEANSLVAGNHTAATILDSVNMSLYMDNTLADTVALNGAYVVDNANNWVWASNNAFLYANNISLSTNGTLRLRYRPTFLIQGTLLPDALTPGTNDGTINWGTNPPNITITIGTVTIRNQTIATNNPSGIATNLPVYNPSPGMVTETNVGSNAGPAYTLVLFVHDATDIDIVVLWYVLAFASAMMYGMAILVLVGLMAGRYLPIAILFGSALAVIDVVLAIFAYNFGVIDHLVPILGSIVSFGFFVALQQLTAGGRGTYSG